MLGQGAALCDSLSVVNISAKLQCALIHTDSVWCVNGISGCIRHVVGSCQACSRVEKIFWVAAAL